MVGEILQYEVGTIIYTKDVFLYSDGGGSATLSGVFFAGVISTVIIVLLISSVIVLCLIMYKRRKARSANIQKLNQEMTFIKNGEMHINVY